MENKEAILRIKEHIRHHKIGEYPHIKIAEALDIAISAIEKQIPKKVIYYVEYYDNHDWYKTENGKIDIWQLDVGHHNGPRCQRCGHMFCVNCVDDYEKEINEPCVIEHKGCPACGEELISMEHHCRCGQMLDWSEYNDN